MNIAPAQVDQTSDSKEVRLGTIYTDSHGRTFRYVKAGASALDRGKLVVAPTVVANHLNMSFAAAPAVGDKEVQVTLGATAATADQYEDGWMIVQDGTGEGRAYPVEGNLPADSAGTCKVYLKEAIDTAGALSESNVDLLANEYNAVVVSATDQADRALGVPIVAIAAGEFGWVQSGGICAVLADEAVNPGLAVTIGTGVAGAVEAVDADTEQIVGYVPFTALVDTEYKAVNLVIDKPIM